MLKRFEVENFKGFDQKVIFDLCARDYSFNNHLIKNGIVNKAILYGKNGIGKSSLGIALLDITSHLTDKERMPAIYLANYRNLTNPNKPVFFKYVFQFGNDELVYEYQKSESDYLISEYLEINHICIIDYSYFDSNKQFIDKSILGSLNVELLDNKLSVLIFIEILLQMPTRLSRSFFSFVTICFGIGVCLREMFIPALQMAEPLWFKLCMKKGKFMNLKHFCVKTAWTILCALNW